jgi:Holliday junction resolvase RusA-like endonuclease
VVEIEVPFVAGKQSPRSTRSGHTFRAVTCQANGDAIAAALGTQLIPDGPLVVVIEAWKKAKRARDIGTACVIKPDSDNIAKLVQDALIADDQRVVGLIVVKCYGAEEKTRVRIFPLDGPVGIELFDTDGPATIILRKKS